MNIYDDNCFQYAIMVVLNHKQIKRDHQILTKINPFINHYEWKDRFPSHKRLEQV